MSKFLAIFLPLSFATTAFASGGMIGGGDVSLRAVLECEAQGIDATFNDTKYVWLAEEVDENGMTVEGTNLRIVTLNSAQLPLNYYVTHQSRVHSLQQVSIPVWQYEVGSSGNQQLGIFQWNQYRGVGSFSPEDLQLTNCN